MRNHRDAAAKFYLRFSQTPPAFHSAYARPCHCRPQKRNSTSECFFRREYLYPTAQEGCSWRQVRVVHFIAALTAISHELLRIPDEELGASSAAVHKHQQPFTIKTALLGNTSRSSTPFPVNLEHPYRREMLTVSIRCSFVSLFTHTYFFISLLLPSVHFIY